MNQKALVLFVFNMLTSPKNVSVDQDKVIPDEEYTFLASIHSSDDERESDEENDAFNESCHGNDFKRMLEESNFCPDFAIKRRKLHTQLDLMNSSLMSMGFGCSKKVLEGPSNLPNSVTRDKSQREMTDEGLKVTFGNIGGNSSPTTTEGEIRPIRRTAKRRKIK